VVTRYHRESRNGAYGIYLHRCPLRTRALPTEVYGVIHLCDNLQFAGSNLLHSWSKLKNYANYRGQDKYKLGFFIREISSRREEYLLQVFQLCEHAPLLIEMRMTNRSMCLTEELLETE
jgi:hypothetical protein